MAKLNETVMVVKISQMLRDHDPANELLDSEKIAAIKAVLSEIVDAENVLIEIETSE